MLTSGRTGQLETVTGTAGKTRELSRLIRDDNNAENRRGCKSPIPHKRRLLWITRHCKLTGPRHPVMAAVIEVRDWQVVPVSFYLPNCEDSMEAIVVFISAGVIGFGLTQVATAIMYAAEVKAAALAEERQAARIEDWGDLTLTEKARVTSAFSGEVFRVNDSDQRLIAGGFVDSWDTQGITHGCITMRGMALALTEDSGLHICPACHGSGGSWWTADSGAWYECEHCAGDGVVDDQPEPLAMYSPEWWREIEAAELQALDDERAIRELAYDM